jgi:hypothetical protein
MEDAWFEAITEEIRSALVKKSLEAPSPEVGVTRVEEITSLERCC